MGPVETDLHTAAAVIGDARVVIGFTGAGTSTESGIPDFRNLGQFWEGFDPTTFEKEIDSREAFERDPENVWRFFEQAIRVMGAARPNAAHQALARLATMGKMAAVITQNVDGLHQAAGSPSVIEFHGNIRRLHCARCGARRGWEDVRDGPLPPRCTCGCVLKPEVPLFGEGIDPEAWGASRVLAENAQVLLLVGAHGAVAPVNRIPLIGREAGAFVVEVNRDRSLYTDRVTDVFLQGGAGEVLTRLAEEVARVLQRNLV